MLEGRESLSPGQTWVRPLDPRSLLLRVGEGLWFWRDTIGLLKAYFDEMRLPEG
jgi:hypothetical protein